MENLPEKSEFERLMSLLSHELHAYKICTLQMESEHSQPWCYDGVFGIEWNFWK